MTWSDSVLEAVKDVVNLNWLWKLVRVFWRKRRDFGYQFRVERWQGRRFREAASGKLAQFLVSFLYFSPILWNSTIFRSQGEAAWINNSTGTTEVTQLNNNHSSNNRILSVSSSYFILKSPGFSHFVVLGCWLTPSLYYLLPPDFSPSQYQTHSHPPPQVQPTPQQHFFHSPSLPSSSGSVGAIGIGSNSNLNSSSSSSSNLPSSTDLSSITQSPKTAEERNEAIYSLEKRRDAIKFTIANLQSEKEMARLSGRPFQSEHTLTHLKDTRESLSDQLIELMQSKVSIRRNCWREMRCK